MGGKNVKVELILTTFLEGLARHVWDALNNVRHKRNGPTRHLARIYIKKNNRMKMLACFLAVWLGEWQWCQTNPHNIVNHGCNFVVTRNALPTVSSIRKQPTDKDVIRQKRWNSHVTVPGCVAFITVCVIEEHLGEIRSMKMCFLVQRKSAAAYEHGNPRDNANPVSWIHKGFLFFLMVMESGYRTYHC